MGYMRADINSKRKFGQCKFFKEFQRLFLQTWKRIKSVLTFSSLPFCCSFFGFLCELFYMSQRMNILRIWSCAPFSPHLTFPALIYPHKTVYHIYAEPGGPGSTVHWPESTECSTINKLPNKTWIAIIFKGKHPCLITERDNLCKAQPLSQQVLTKQQLHLL